jgi:tetratricopeptide (TPR) repeat protein
VKILRTSGGVGFVLICGLLLASIGCKKEKEAKRSGTAPVSKTTDKPDDTGKKPETEKTAPLLEGMGEFHREISTKSPEAQKFFDQGMVLAWGFNHAEANRSFLEAARLDPDCAICYWGAAWVLGPNINAKMDSADAPRAWEHLQKAVALKGKAKDWEQAWIGALEKRYVAENPEDRAKLDQAFADELRGVVKKFPDDVDTRALLAEALMDLHPWDYWDLKKKKAQPWTGEILKTIEGVLATNEKHVAANHLYIHAVEASPNDAKRAEASADRLRDLVPGAGHLVHMPSHIYIRLGRYADGSTANEAAIKADQAYLTQCRSQGIYPLAYHPHNFHFLWATASFEGRSEKAIDAAKQVASKVPPDKMACHGWGTLQHYHVIPLYAYARFGKWDELLAAPKPEASLIYPTAVWHYARGLAHVGKNQLPEAEKELEEVRKLASEKKPELKKVTIWDINSSYALIQIAAKVLAGELAARKGDSAAAIKELEGALELEASLNYDEPADWYYPVRHALGAVYLEAKKAKDAERVYREDLEFYPENGFALFGLKQALEMQKKTADAAAVDARFKKAWAAADHQLATSRY